MGRQIRQKATKDQKMGQGAGLSASAADVVTIELANQGETAWAEEYTVYGWGVYIHRGPDLNDGPTPAANILQWVTVPTWTWEKCNKLGNDESYGAILI